MLKAFFNTRSGAVVTIEGPQEEVADLLTRLEGEKARATPPRAQRALRSEGGPRPTPAGLLEELIAEGLFSQPKGLGSVRDTLQERGHFYPLTTLSPLMLRLVRKKELRRIKDKTRWTYVR